MLNPTPKVLSNSINPPFSGFFPFRSRAACPPVNKIMPNDPYDKDMSVQENYFPNSVTNLLKVMFVSVLSCGIKAYCHAFSFLALFISVAFLQ